MGTVRKVGKMWYAFWRDANGDRHSKSVSTKKRDAEDYLARIDADQAKGVVYGYTPIPFSRFADEFLENYAALYFKPSSLEHARTEIRVHIKPFFGDQIVGTIEPSRCQAYLGLRRKEGAAPSTIKRELNLIKSMFRQAVVENYANESPAAKIRNPVIEPREMECLSRDQVIAFLNAVPPGYRLMMAIAVLMGLRVGEYTALKWEDVDFGNHVIIVKKSMHNGKPNSPKTKCSRRSVDMPPDVEKALRARRDLLKPEQTDLIFSTANGKPYERSNIRSRILLPALEKAHLPQIRLHDLRHTYAALMIAQGAPMKYIQEMMGHSSIRVTMDLYGHLLQNVRDKEAKVLSDSIFHCGEASAYPLI